MADVREAARLDVEKARAVRAKLAALGYAEDEGLDRMPTDLSDLYSAAAEYRRLLDAWLAVADDDREGAADALIELAVQMRHIHYHLRHGIRAAEDLADELYEDDLPSAVRSAAGED